MPVRRLCLMPLLVACLLLTATSAGAAQVYNLTAPEAYALVQNQPDLFLLDVRTPGEYLQLRLKKAHLIPVDQLFPRLGELPKDRPLLVYCSVGSRSSRVAKYLAGHGFDRVYNLVGGIWGWQLRGYPLLQGPP